MICEGHRCEERCVVEVLMNLSESGKKSLSIS